MAEEGVMTLKEGNNEGNDSECGIKAFDLDAGRCRAIARGPGGD